jgi:AraC-like DNA-binding protein
MVGTRGRAVLYVPAARGYTGPVEGLERGSVSRRRDDARLWRVGAFGGLDLLRAFYVDFSFPPHTHEEFLIAVTESGTALPRYRGSMHLHGPGDVLVLNPGEVHGGGPAGRSIWRYRAFYPPTILMQQAGEDLAGTDLGYPKFAKEVVRDPYLADMLRRAHVAFEALSSALERESHLLRALVSLIARHAVDRLAARAITAEHRAVARARGYLEALPSENVSLLELGREAGLSPFHLCRVFRREIGLSPHLYQMHIRVRLAKSLLAKGRSISQAAAEAGFCDQAHLTRHFKRFFGVTPGRYHREGSTLLGKTGQ